jgi:serine-type D-Ala-D-Ala carboxypeptidase (penicillin-binding protein 5/6)
MPLLLLMLAILLDGSPAAGQGELATRLHPLVEAHAGRVAVVVKHLEGPDQFAHDADEPFPTASLIKVPVMVEFYRQAARGDLDPQLKVALSDDDRVPGSGILTPHFSAGAELSLRDAVRLMIAFSDNTATNLVLKQIGLPATAATMEELGYSETKIHSYVFRRDSSILPERSRRFGLGSTTAAEMARLLETLHRRELVSPDASDEMIAHLHACQDRAKLARFLPPNARLAHKSGSVAAVRCDAGILETPRGPVVIVVLTADNEDQSWGTENAAEVLCGRIGQAVWNHFQDHDESPKADEEDAAATRLAQGSSGRLVEDLQRTLNARLDPSPELSVDGDFGPITAAAVRRFQQQHDLGVTGTVDSLTWQRLGPLVTDDQPVDAPEIVNREKLPVEPADPPHGQPFVTAKAWAIADGATGELLAGENERQPLPMASTTKIMTAYLILKRAADEPQILEEIVTFSQRADDTIGSTCGLRAGEQISVGELLYGLLLPSGNDAAVALAEHFGRRWGDSADDPDGSERLIPANVLDGPLSSEEKFIEWMNAEAEQLGMTDTRFANPHGLTARRHHASAVDLIRLARAAMELPRFPDYVATRRRGCEVEGPGGYRRHVVWNNTNRLLRIEGYEGIKTGTTTAAGACLVSSVRRDDGRLLAAVLGSESAAGRYADTRNLLRWARQKRSSGRPVSNEHDFDLTDD